MQKFKIKQATKQTYVECENFGVADLSYPGSKTRRGRVQMGGQISPTLTCTDNALFRLERYEDNDMNLKVKELLNEDKCVRVEDTDTGETYRIAIRKLLCEECFILQGMTADDVAKCRAMGLSNSALYKIAGNGLSSNTIQFIAESLYKSVIDKNYKTTAECMIEQYGRA